MSDRSGVRIMVGDFEELHLRPEDRLGYRSPFAARGTTDPAIANELRVLLDSVHA